jgi:hypothetical protein
MDCDHPRIKKAFDTAAHRYKRMLRNPDGSPVNPNYPSAVIWECITAFGIDGLVNVHRPNEIRPVRRAFAALFAAEMELDAAGENVPRLLAIVKRVRIRVLATVRRSLSA